MTVTQSATDQLMDAMYLAVQTSMEEGVSQ
jgi:hypothetical protein